MSVLIRVMRFSRREFGRLAVCAGVIFCLLPIPLGLVTRAFFDRIARRPAGPDPWTVLALFVGLQVASVAGELALAFPWSGLQQRTHSLFQHNLFAGILRGYGRHGLAESPAAAISRFRDEPLTITSGSLDAMCDLAGRSAFAVVAAVVMWRVNPIATAAAFAPVLLTSAVADALGTRAADYAAAARQATSRLSGFVGELVAAHLTVTVAGAAGRATARLAAMGEDRRRLAVRDTVFSQALNSLNFHVVHVGTGAVLLLAASAIRRHSFSVGDFALFVVFLDELTYLPAEIGRLITELKQTDRAVGRMHALVPGETRDALTTPVTLHLERVPRPLPARGDGDHLRRLDVDGLTYQYRSHGRGVIDASFTLERGSFTVVTGRIGAGKTTLVHTLLGLLPASAGEVRWNGHPVADPAVVLVPPRAALAPQVPRLFSDTLRDNILLGRAARPDALDRAVRAAVLEGDLAVFDRGIDTLVGARGVRLSGGQLLRASAARMFLSNAELLVIDDLSSALDAETEAELWRRLFDRGTDVTCLVVSHRPAALRRADQILLMDEGRLLAAGPLEDLLATSATMRDLWQGGGAPQPPPTRT